MLSKAQKPVSFQQWLDTVPQEIKHDPLWPSLFYQKALFLYELGWINTEPWSRDLRGRELAAQMIRSSGSISANIEEGFDRGFGRDYARFLTIALASARETRGWYFRARYLLNPLIVTHQSLHIRFLCVLKLLVCLCPSFNNKGNKSVKMQDRGYSLHLLSCIFYLSILYPRLKNKQPCQNELISLLFSLSALARL